MSGVTLLLPHGYEGQGPEHSSARIERYLQLCAERNMRCAIRPRRPAISTRCAASCTATSASRGDLFTPKSLLRHKLAVSSLADMSDRGTFQFVIPEIDPIAPPDKVRRVVICSGKVYYDLLAERRAHEETDVAIIRLEQLYPFPENTLGRVLAPYHNADVVWCQEEPENMGAWSFVDRRIEKVLGRLDSKVTRPDLCRTRGGGEPGNRPGAHAYARAGDAGRRRAGHRLRGKHAQWRPRSTCRRWAKASRPPPSARWMKQQGDPVAADEPLVELETDKVTVEVTAPAAGVLSSIAAPEGSEVEVGALLATLEAGAAAPALDAGATATAAPTRRRARCRIRRPACIRRPAPLG